jgi:hypothetical protein
MNFASKVSGPRRTDTRTHRRAPRVTAAGQTRAPHLQSCGSLLITGADRLASW